MYIQTFLEENETWTNGKWLVQHLHQSTPDLEQMDGEEFPLTLGKQVKKKPAGLSCNRHCLLSYLKAELKNEEDRTCQKIPKNGFGYKR